MSNNQTNNKRIAKNAAALYFRTFVTMIIGLYTSRVVLKTLGVMDYGIYNVVGGFVMMFSVVTGALQGSISRFLNYELGAENKERVTQVFSTSFWIMCILSVIIIILTETIGIWYLKNKMVIPIERFEAAFFVFQFSVITFVLELLSAPYNAAIISHERMDVYAYISIADGIMKLIICYLVMMSPIDALIFYAGLRFAVALIDRLIYGLFCSKHFEECKILFCIDRPMLSNMFGFAGWSFISSVAVIARTQGGNLLLNFFGGPVINAAHGVSSQIAGVVTMFVHSFTQAFNPQITKRYAAGEYDSLMNLLIFGTKYSYFLMFIIALPLFLSAEYIIELWLVDVPEHTVAFARITLIYLLVEVLSKPIITAKNATGRIRNYSVIVAGIIMLTLPLSYVALVYGAPVEIVAVMNVVTSLLAFGARMYMLRGEFPKWASTVFIRKVVLRILAVSVVSCIFPVFCYLLIPKGIMNFIITSCVSLISTVLCVLFIGCSRIERQIVITRIVAIKTKLTREN